MKLAATLLLLLLAPLGGLLAQRPTFGSSRAIGLELAGVRLSRTSRPPGLALRVARARSLSSGWSWRLEGDLSLNTPNASRFGAMGYFGAAFGPTPVSTGPYLLLGAGPLFTMGGVGESSNLSPAFGVSLGWEALLGERRYFAEVRALVPAWRHHGPAFVALLIGVPR